MAINKEIQRNYYYSIDASFLLDKESKIINITNLSIVNDYENSFSPVAYIRAQLSEELYYTMINEKNRDKGRIVLNVQLYNPDTQVTSSYFKKTFLYEFPRKSLVKDRSDVEGSRDITKEDSTSYKQTYIGLIDIDSLNRNKMIINNLFVESNIASITHYYLTQDIIREPFDNNPDFDVFYIPPMEGIPELLKYINSRSSFYNTSFRYFDGYNCAYLLSNKGNPIEPNDNTYSTFHIRVSSASSDPNKNTIIDGYMENRDQKCYYIDVLDTVVQFDVNTIQDNLFNQIYAIDSEGNKEKINMDINHIEASKTKPKFMRVFDNNFNYAKSQANLFEIESSAIMITCYMINNVVLDPSREYILEFPEDYKDKNGKYILTKKGEVYMQKGNNFVNTTTLYFKRVINKEK